MYARVLRRIEDADTLDVAVDKARPIAGKFTANERMRDFLHGETTGIPVHVILTDVPFGAWWMAIFLDCFHDRGSRDASTKLVALGIVAAAPTAVSGWAEWSLKRDRRTQRVGVVPAAANAVAVLVFTASWRARTKGNHRRGIRLARVGAVLLLVSGFLGGHMGSGRRATEGD